MEYPFKASFLVLFCGNLQIKLYFCPKVNKTMKKILIAICMTCLLGACGNNDNEKAQVFLQQAEKAWEAGDYNGAKILIDSVRLRYPKAFEARKQGVKLMQRVELDEQKKSLVYLDSAWQTKNAEFKAIKANYVLEKDTAYQEVGNYLSPTQTVEKNINRTFLRAQVTEKGVMSLTSIYCSKGSLHHKAVKVTSGDTFAETPASTDVYETTDLGWKIEKADYILGKDGGVIGFIVLNKDNPIKVEFIGERSYKATLWPADKKAIADVYALAQVLSAMEQIKKEQEEANRKIAFITRKMQENEQQHSEE